MGGYAVRCGFFCCRFWIGEYLLHPAYGKIQSVLKAQKKDDPAAVLIMIKLRFGLFQFVIDQELHNPVPRGHKHS